MDVMPGKRTEIVTLHKHTAKTYREIASLVGVSLATVSRVIKLKQETGSLSPKRKGKCGRKKKTTPRDDAYLLQQSKKDPHKTSDALKMDLKEKGIEISSSTVRRRLIAVRRKARRQIRKKGAEGINKASLERGDELFILAGEKVHSECRQRYVNPKDIKIKQRTNAKPPKRSARVSQSPFNSQTDCLFCGITVTPGSSGVSYVKTEVFVNTIIECCNNRLDEWASTVKGRIEYYQRDLHATGCVYHHSCSSNFRSGLHIPLQFNSEQELKCSKPCRPKNEEQEQAFLKVCSYLENNDNEQLTIAHLQEKMKGFLEREDSQPFGRSYIKEKLKQQYGQNIYFTEGEGCNDIVTMREKTSNILRSYFSNLAEDEESQKRAIIETAARLIKSDIKSTTPCVTGQYPSENFLNLESAISFIPESLQRLLNGIFVGKNINKKVAWIGHAIIQAARPRYGLSRMSACGPCQTENGENLFSDSVWEEESDSDGNIDNFVNFWLTKDK